MVNPTNKTKVFGVGFHKTGTSTLNDVLQILGYRVCGNKNVLAKDLLNNDLSRLDSFFEEYDAFQDNPWPLLYKEFYQKYPESKFILTTRDEDKWWNSLLNHFGSEHTPMRQWIYGNGVPEGNEPLYRERYRQHNKEVIDFFSDKPEQLLVIDWKENDSKWERICEFLEKPVPQSNFPHANKKAYTKLGRAWQEIKLFYYRTFIKPKRSQTL